MGWRLDLSDEAPNVHFWEYNSRDAAGNLVDTSGRLPASRRLTMPADRELIENYSDPVFVLGGDWKPRDVSIFWSPFLPRTTPGPDAHN